jgi:hypothetical protein
LFTVSLVTAKQSSGVDDCSAKIKVGICMYVLQFFELKELFSGLFTRVNYSFAECVVEIYSSRGKKLFFKSSDGGLSDKKVFGEI